MRTLDDGLLCIIVSAITIVLRPVDSLILDTCLAQHFLTPFDISYLKRLDPNIMSLCERMLSHALRIRQVTAICLGSLTLQHESQAEYSIEPALNAT